MTGVTRLGESGPAISGWRRKFTIPPPRASAAALPRPRLTAQIDHLLDVTGLVVLAAGDGFGKTTVAAEWARQAPRVAWLSLDRRDRDPATLLVNSIRAIREVEPDFAPEALLVARADPDRVEQSAFPLAVTALETLAEPITVVIDDIDRLEAGDARDGLIRMVRYQPHQLRLLLITRDDGLLELERLRVEGRLADLREDDLRLTREEALAIAEEVVARDGSGDLPAVDPQLFDRLYEETGGWPVGIALGCQAALQGHDLALNVQSLPVLSFLRRATVEWLPDELAQFMLDVCVLGVVRVELAVHVTGREDAGLLLEELQRRHILDPPRQENGRVWHVARVLREFALTESTLRDADHTIEVHSRAAEWLADNGSLERAMAHAALADDDDELTTRYLLQGYMVYAATGHAMWVRRQAAELAGRRPDRPHLHLAEAWAAVIAGSDADAEAALELATARTVPEPLATAVQAGAHAIRSHLRRRSGAFSDAVTEATTAMEMFQSVVWPADQQDELFGYGLLERLHLHLGIACFSAGQLDDAEESFWQMATSDLPAATRSVAHAYLALLDWIDGQSDASTQGRITAIIDSRRGRGPDMAVFINAAVLALHDPGEIGADAQLDVEIIASQTPEPGASIIACCSRLVRVASDWSLHRRRDLPSFPEQDDAEALFACASTLVAELPETGVFRRLLDRVAEEIGRAAPDATFGQPLTDGESRVLAAMRGPLTEREIARELHLSHNTVRTYRRRLYRKLGVSSRAAAVGAMASLTPRT